MGWGGLLGTSSSESSVTPVGAAPSLQSRKRELLLVGGLCAVGALIGIPSIRPLFQKASPSIQDFGPSWHIGLAAALAQHLQYGPQYLSTYGPLGFLHLSMVYPTAVLTATAALVPAALYILYPVALLLFANLVRRTAHAGRVEGLTVLIGTALVALWTDVATDAGTGMELLCLVALATCLLRPTSRFVPYLALAAGIGLAFEALFKVDLLYVALAELLVLTLGVWLVPRRPVRVVWLAWAGLVCGYLALWVATGQQLSNLPRYWIGTWQISSGYSAAMALASQWKYVLLIAVLAIAGIGFPVLLRAWRNWRPSPQELVIALSVPWLFVSWKDGLVRIVGLELANERALALLAAVMGVAWLVTLMGPSLRSRFALGPAATCCLCAVVAVLVFSPGEYQSWVLTQIVRQPASTSSATTGPDYIPATVVASLRGQTVNALPWDISLVVDNHLKWDPLPEAQTYSAYTPYLDHLDAAQLASPKGARRLVISLLDIDSRYLLWDPPAVWKTVISRYSCIGVTGLSVVAARGAPRIGPDQTLSRGTASLDKWVPVPSTNLPYEFADVHIGTSLEGKAVAFLLRQTPIYAALRLSNGAVVGPVRFVAATAGDGLYLSHYVSTSRQLCGLLSGRTSQIASIVAVKFTTPRPSQWTKSIGITFVGAS